MECVERERERYLIMDMIMDDQLIRSNSANYTMTYQLNLNQPVQYGFRLSILTSGFDTD